MAPLDIFIPGTPIAKGRPRVTTRSGFARAYTPERTRNYEETAAGIIRKWWGGRATIIEPCEVNIIALFPRPQRLLKRGADDERIPHGARSDIDNIAKSILDALTLGGVFADDCVVYALTARKYYAARNEEPGAWVEISI